MSKLSDVIIRPARLTDAGAIVELWRALGWFPHIDDEPRADTEARIAGHLELCFADDSHMVLVAENGGGAFAGFVSVHWLPYLFLAGPEGYITELFVVESERGKGIGSMLLSEVGERAKERGCSRLQLVTGKARDSYKFYHKLGWKERPELADFVLQSV
jgi:GNAT superfamily N-acetyltransferase